MSDMSDMKDGGITGVLSDANNVPNLGANIWQRQEIESPCVSICIIHEPSGLCIGCHRSRPEIAGWSRLSPDDRREIMDTLPARGTQLKNKRQGRRRRQQA